MASLYLSVRLPEKHHERVKLSDINLSTKNVADLKNEAEKLLNFPHNELGKVCNTHDISKYKKLINLIQNNKNHLQNSFTVETYCRTTANRCRNVAFELAQRCMYSRSNMKWSIDAKHHPVSKSKKQCNAIVLFSKKWLAHQP